jgi:hypothetical protein
MATEKFPSELASRGTVKTTDKLIIHNIDTGATEYTTVANLLANYAPLSSPQLTDLPRVTRTIYGATAEMLRLTNAGSGVATGAYITFYMAGSNYGIVESVYNAVGGAALQLYHDFNSYPTPKLRINNNGIAVFGLPEYNDNANASASGLAAGSFYRTGDVLKVVH